ncbi:hypothetical protein DM992_38185 [Burkholderia sp. JP2-270]|nr:hypothetical protein DM992_38185 [Burkholderia sp. JP2-270]
MFSIAHCGQAGAAFIAASIRDEFGSVDKEIPCEQAARPGKGARDTPANGVASRHRRTQHYNAIHIT